MSPEQKKKKVLLPVGNLDDNTLKKYQLFYDNERIEEQCYDCSRILTGDFRTEDSFDQIKLSTKYLR